MRRADRSRQHVEPPAERRAPPRADRLAWQTNDAAEWARGSRRSPLKDLRRRVWPPSTSIVDGAQPLCSPCHRRWIHVVARESTGMMEGWQPLVLSPYQRTAATERAHGLAQVVQQRRAAASKAVGEPASGSEGGEVTTDKRSRGPHMVMKGNRSGHATSAPRKTAAQAP